MTTVGHHLTRRAASSPLTLEAAQTEARWTAACAASGQPVTAFHTWTWLRAAAAMTAHRFVPLVLTQAGHDLGVVPVLIRRRGLFATLDCVPFPYCGPLVPPSLLSPCLDLLHRQARRHRVIRTVVQFPPGCDLDERVPRDHGFTIDRDATYVLDTSVSQEVLWSGLTSECRRRVKVAERNGIELDPSPPPELLDVFHDTTFGERGLRSGYVGRLSAHLDALNGPDLRIRRVAAVRDQEVLGVLVTLASESLALGWMGGVFPAHRSSHAGFLLYWDAIRWTHSIGARSLDMVGVPNEGIARFKRQFGGALQPFVIAQHDSRVATWVEGAQHRLVRAPEPRWRPPEGWGLPSGRQ